MKLCHLELVGFFWLPKNIGPLNIKWLTNIGPLNIKWFKHFTVYPIWNQKRFYCLNQKRKGYFFLLKSSAYIQQYDLNGLTLMINSMMIYFLLQRLLCPDWICLRPLLIAFIYLKLWNIILVSWNARLNCCYWKQLLFNWTVTCQTWYKNG